MKLLIIGDQHFRYRLPYSGGIEDERQGEWDSVIQTIHEAASGCDAIILLGDNLNTRHNHSSVNRRFIEFVRGFGKKDVHIIAGNHERYGKETAIDFLKEITDWENVHVYTNPSTNQIKHGKETLNITFLPFMTPGSLDCESLEDAKRKVVSFCSGGDILFHHHIIEGTIVGGANLSDMNEIILPISLSEKYKWVIGGHIHEAQSVSDHVKVTGNIFTHEVGEKEKYVWVLDTKKDTFNGVKLPVRGIYRVTLAKEEDVGKIEDIPKHSIVKCIVTNRMIDIDSVKKKTKRFDSSIIIEQYPNERKRIDLDKAGEIDLSIDNLMKMYAKSKNINYKDMKEAMDMLP